MPQDHALALKQLLNRQRLTWPQASVGDLVGATSPKPRALGRFVTKQAIEIVLADAAIGPAVLEQETG